MGVEYKCNDVESRLLVILAADTTGSPSFVIRLDQRRLKYGRKPLVWVLLNRIMQGVRKVNVMPISGAAVAMNSDFIFASVNLVLMHSSEEIINMEASYGAHNYHPLEVVISKAEGVWVWDPEGRKYLDMLSAYSAVNQGHRHPKIVQALKDQLDRVTLTSRAFYNDKMAPFLKHLCEVAKMDMALPMNTGAEAVETGIKIARKWGYEVKGVKNDKAEIIVCDDNFHGRTTTIVGFSSDPIAYTNFGPKTPGFVRIPFNDADALEKAINENTVAFLLEPIQGEAGIKIPDEGYLRKVREICTKNNVLLVLDEIQTGLGRTGRMFCFEHDGIRPDVLLVGKALGGGVYPVSAALASREIMKVITPGTHGSTFGGNPLGAVVGDASLDVLVDEKLPERAAELGAHFHAKIQELNCEKFKEIRARGLFLAIDVKPEHGKARKYTNRLKELGLLAKETHVTTIRFAPPLVISKEEVDWAVEQIRTAFFE